MEAKDLISYYEHRRVNHPDADKLEKEVIRGLELMFGSDTNVKNIV